MPESDGETVLHLIDAQLVECIFVRSFEDRLDHCESDASGLQRTMQFLQCGKPMQMAAPAPVLKREKALRPYAKIR